MFKKLKKQISFKNLVKTVGKVGSLVPGVGGMVGGLVQGAQDAHYAKKAAAQEAKNIQLQTAAVEAQMRTSNPNIGDILIGAGGGALTGAGAVLGGSSTAGQAGASVVQSTLKEWFKLHWWKVAIGVSVIGGVIYFAVRKGNKGVRRR